MLLKFLVSQGDGFTLDYSSRDQGATERARLLHAELRGICQENDVHGAAHAHQVCEALACTSLIGDLNERGVDKIIEKLVRRPSCLPKDFVEHKTFLPRRLEHIELDSRISLAGFMELLARP